MFTYIFGFTNILPYTRTYIKYQNQKHCVQLYSCFSRGIYWKEDYISRDRNMYPVQTWIWYVNISKWYVGDWDKRKKQIQTKTKRNQNIYEKKKRVLYKQRKPSSLFRRHFEWTLFSVWCVNSTWGALFVRKNLPTLVGVIGRKTGPRPISSLPFLHPSLLQLWWCATIPC